MTGNRTVLNNTLNARDGRYPRTTDPDNHVQPYILYYNIIPVCKKKTHIIWWVQFFRVNIVAEKKPNIRIRTLAETKRTIIIIIHMLKYYNRYVPICATVHNNILYSYTRRQNNNTIPNINYYIFIYVRPMLPRSPIKRS